MKIHNMQIRAVLILFCCAICTTSVLVVFSSSSWAFYFPPSVDREDECERDVHSCAVCTKINKITKQMKVWARTRHFFQFFLSLHFVYLILDHIYTPKSRSNRRMDQFSWVGYDEKKTTTNQQSCNYFFFAFSMHNCNIKHFHKMIFLICLAFMWLIAMLFANFIFCGELSTCGFSFERKRTTTTLIRIEKCLVRKKCFEFNTRSCNEDAWSVFMPCSV